MKTSIKAIILTIVILGFALTAFSQTCKPKPIVFPAGSTTVTLNGNIKKCPEYLLKIKKNQRLQVKLNSPNSDVYFAMDFANQTEEEEGGDFFCEDCKKLDEFFDFAEIWKIFVYGIETAENKYIAYTLTLTLTDSTVIKGGVLNGKAISLPKPPFPKEARETGASGSVSVKVVIDEEGNVATAQCFSGNEAFYVVAEQAAMNAKFSPTLLSGKPVRVEGVIVYNFKP